jgi:hypothetical protein
MTQTQGALDDAPRLGLFGRLKDAVIGPLKFLFAGALIGGVLGHIVAKPVYVSRGYLQVGAAPTPGVAFVPGPKVPLTEAIISTALSAAKQDPAGASLPPSASTALDHAAITFGPNNNVVEISYRASDAAAAGDMAMAIMKVYGDAVVAASSDGSVPAITVIAAPVEGRGVRNTSFEVTAVLMGAGIGIALYVALWAMRTARP